MKSTRNPPKQRKNRASLWVLGICLAMALLAFVVLKITTPQVRSVEVIFVRDVDGNERMGTVWVGQFEDKSESKLCTTQHLANAANKFIQA